MQAPAPLTGAVALDQPDDFEILLIDNAVDDEVVSVRDGAYYFRERLLGHDRLAAQAALDNDRSLKTVIQQQLN